MTEMYENGNQLTIKHRAEFGSAYDSLKFVSEDEASRAEECRNEILKEIDKDIIFKNKQTKPVYRSLSNGCALCSTGAWSCLFINGKCNCRCFYCPTEQNAVGLPTTNTLTFPRVQDYADYVGQLEFEGVSISGGEPLLTLDTSLKFIAAVKRKFGDRIYLWLYTNGTLVTYDILLRLRDAGLNEIRFDIGATGYTLKKACMAVGLIDHVTVEIPAVPEDYDFLKAALPVMSQSGISFLNLHQLRLTPHNVGNLIGRNYTYLHGEHLTVLESELTALRLMRQASESRIPLGINYCSFVYKNRFQRAAARRRCGRLVRNPHEDITENGYIRSLYVQGPADAMRALAESLMQGNCRSDDWRMTAERDRIYFNSYVWPLISFEGIRLGVSYFDSSLVPSISYRNLFKEIPLNKNRSIFVERVRGSDDLEISERQRKIFEALIIKEEESIPLTDAEAALNPILQYETVPAGLQIYA